MNANELMGSILNERKINSVFFVACGGSLTACAWKTDCLSWKIPSPEARASFGITGNGWPDGKGR